MIGTIFKEDELVCEGVRISIDKMGSQHIRKGFAYLPSGVEIDPGEYVLKLDDGTSSAIVIMSVSGGIAIFRGPQESI